MLEGQGNAGLLVRLTTGGISYHEILLIINTLRGRESRELLLVLGKRHRPAEIRRRGRVGVERVLAAVSGPEIEVRGSRPEYRRIGLFLEHVGELEVPVLVERRDMDIFQVGVRGLRGTGRRADGGTELDAASLVESRGLVLRAGSQRDSREAQKKYRMFQIR